MSPATNELLTERLTLRVWKPDEAARLLDIRGREEVARWLGNPTPWVELSTAVEKIREWSALTLAPGPLGEWAIDSGDDSGPHGTVRLGLLPYSDEVEIGWYLHPDSGGHGFASEAAQTVLDHAIASGIRQIWAIMWPDNVASARVATSIGMTDLGVINDQWYGTEADPLSRMFVSRPNTTD